METFTQMLLSELGRPGAAAGMSYRHVNIAVNRSQREQSAFRPRKLISLLRQVALAGALAVRGYDAYYPISQNRMGLLRDMALLVPFRLSRRAVILHLHGGALDQVLIEEAQWMRTAVHAIAGRPKTYGIVLTPGLRRCLEPLVRPGRISVVPNPVRVPTSIDDPADQQRSLTVLYLSTLIPSKGYRELVRAVSALAGSGVDVELDLAGEVSSPVDMGWIEAYAGDPAVRFRGPLTGKAKWSALERAHVLALPSVAPEGQPLAILEGMAAGCAILTTAQGGIPETVQPPHGAVLERLEGDALEAEIKRILAHWSQNRDEVARAGREARTFAERSFGPDRFIRRWLAASTRDGS